MSAILPRVFIGSSTEAEIFANALQRALSADADVKTWRNAPEFKPTHSTLSSLQNAAVNYDFGVFIFGPDDVTVSRGEKTVSTRDNVLRKQAIWERKVET
jgi:predicted nucleotide-binding protein